MKVTLQQLRPNPYRDLARYPIHREKIEALKASIRSTGFWDNIVIRKAKDGDAYEVAYGHHRIEALKELQRDDLLESGFSMDLPIRKLDDPTMIRIMANENVQEFQVSSDIIDETVRVAREYLSAQNKTPLNEISASDLSQFLGGSWNEDKVGISLQRLGLFDRGTIKRDQLKGLSHTAAKAVQREVGKVEKTMLRDEMSKLEESGEEVTEAERKNVRARVQKVANHVAQNLSDHVRNGGGLGEMKIKSLDAQAEMIPPDAPPDDQKLSTIDAAARSLNSKEFQRKVELLMQYRSFMSSESQTELREKLLELADWCAQMAEQLDGQ
jgi:ParB-like chromosome segregation protein Spo0J